MATLFMLTSARSRLPARNGSGMMSKKFRLRSDHVKLHSLILADVVRPAPTARVAAWVSAKGLGERCHDDPVRALLR
jgi:hypothetical protein